MFFIAVIKDDKIIRINQYAHSHEPEFEKIRTIENENRSTEQIQNKKKTFPKKIQELFR